MGKEYKHVAISPDHKKKLKRMAFEQDISIKEVVENLIDKKLEESK